jgi:hypothetical protein
MLAGKLDMPEDEAEVWLVSRELTPNPNLKTPSPKPQAPNPKPQTPSPQPQTLSFKPQATLYDDHYLASTIC